MLKSEQISDVKNVMFFSEEINKTALSVNNNERIESINWIEINVYGSREVAVCKKKEIKCNDIKNNIKMNSFKYVAKEHLKN